MDYQLIDLIDQAKVQSLMDSFSELNGVANGILDLEGGMVTGSGWKRICIKYHRNKAKVTL
jgi:ligand-binding sensor protein